MHGPMKSLTDASERILEIERRQDEALELLAELEQRLDQLLAAETAALALVKPLVTVTTAA